MASLLFKSEGFRLFNLEIAASAFQHLLLEILFRKTLIMTRCHKLDRSVEGVSILFWIHGCLRDNINVIIIIIIINLLLLLLLKHVY